MTMMTAFQVPSAGGALEKVERPLPEPAADEVRIAVHACGVCHSDSITVEGHMPGISYPRVASASALAGTPVHVAGAISAAGAMPLHA